MLIPRVLLRIYVRTYEMPVLCLGPPGLNQKWGENLVLFLSGSTIMEEMLRRTVVSGSHA